MVVCEGLEPIFSSLRGLRLNQFVLHTIWWCWGDLNPTSLPIESRVTQPVCLQHHIRCILKTVKKVYSLPFNFIVGKVSFGNILRTLSKQGCWTTCLWVILLLSQLPINQLCEFIIPCWRSFVKGLIKFIFYFFRESLDVQVCFISAVSKMCFDNSSPALISK